MEIRDEVLLEVVAVLEEADKKNKNSAGAATALSHLFDDVYKSMSPMQVALLQRWHNYVCKKCGHTMVAKTPSDYDGM
jgi:rubrerythrin